MSINTQGHPPITKKPYCTPLTKCAIVDKAIDDMLKAKVIKPSKSPQSCPIVIIDKKDGTNHFCVDYLKSEQDHNELIPDYILALGTAFRTKQTIQ